MTAYFYKKIFIELFGEKRLNIIQREVPNMAKIFKDYDFHINYGTVENLFEVAKVYEDNVKKLTFENNLRGNWGEVTLGLIEKVKTPYTMILCEDLEVSVFRDVLPLEVSVFRGVRI